ncbi:minor capsid protein [Carnobacterium sp. TMP28]|uniref:minor capsid protein n=1 Tax=Carnobacterium sp. TMP28 TaxID=3397060 RepID=UPI0039E14100
MWNDTNLLAEKLQELFTTEAMTGMSQSDMVREIQNTFDVSRGVSRRLIRTEANYMSGQGKLKGWVAQGVEYYVIVATLDLRTSKICQEEDCKKYKVTEVKVNVNYPPYRPFVERSPVLILEKTPYVVTVKQ